MLTTDQLLNGLPRDLTLRFFATFARFEFALKHTGFWWEHPQYGTAMANRQKLADRLGAEFFEHVCDEDLAPTLISAPPKQLIVQEDGALVFGEQPPAVASTRALLKATWDVRNNLFHGNKMFPANRTRDHELMTDALAVIGAVLNKAEEVGARFQDPQV